MTKKKDAAFEVLDLDMKRHLQGDAEDSHDLPANIAFYLRLASRAMQANFERIVRENGFGTTPTETRTLLFIHRMEPVHQVQIARAMGIEPMSLSEIVTKLEARGFVKREQDPRDRRARLVSTTKQADPIIDKFKGLTQDLITRATDGIEGEKKEKFLSALVRFTSNLTTIENEARHAA